jgi:hypothetical protein
MKRRGLRRFALALLSIYWGNAAAQWLWTHGGYAVLMPISRIEKKICKDDGRESVTELIHFRRKFLSVSGLLSRLNARSRSRAWKVLEDPPPKYPVYYSVLASDRTTNPKRGWWILRAVYGKPVGRYQIPGKRRNVGGHGMLAEHWRVWQESARCFLSYRTRNHI